jgi:hypothetical protein
MPSADANTAAFTERYDVWSGAPLHFGARSHLTSGPMDSVGSEVFLSLISLKSRLKNIGATGCRSPG